MIDIKMLYSGGQKKKKEKKEVCVHVRHTFKRKLKMLPLIKAPIKI